MTPGPEIPTTEDHPPAAREHSATSEALGGQAEAIVASGALDESPDPEPGAATESKPIVRPIAWQAEPPGTVNTPARPELPDCTGLEGDELTLCDLHRSYLSREMDGSSGLKRSESDPGHCRVTELADGAHGPESALRIELPEFDSNNPITRLVPGEPVTFDVVVTEEGETARLSEGTLSPDVLEIYPLDIDVSMKDRSLTPSADRAALGGRCYGVKVRHRMTGAEVLRWFTPDFEALFGPEPSEVTKLELILKQDGSVIRPCGAGADSRFDPSVPIEVEIRATDRNRRTYFTGLWVPRLPLFRLAIAGEGVDIRQTSNLRIENARDPFVVSARYRGSRLSEINQRFCNRLEAD